MKREMGEKEDIRSKSERQRRIMQTFGNWYRRLEERAEIKTRTRMEWNNNNKNTANLIYTVDRTMKKK